MSLIYKHEARGGSAYKSATNRKGGVISDLFAEQRERRRMLIGFLPNKERSGYWSGSQLSKRV